MTRLSKLTTVVNQNSLGEVIEKVWDKILLRGPISPIISSLVGKEIQDQIYMLPIIGYWPTIHNPSSFNEKVAYRKHHTNKKIFSELADKWRVRDYVEERVGEEILTEVYLISDDPESIPFESLPNQFVIKATHGSGMGVIVDDKQSVDYQLLREVCGDWLQTEYGDTTNEYWYGQIKPRILVEERIEAEGQHSPIDYKFFVFDGKVKAIQVDLDRYSNHTRKIYNPDWECLEFRIKYPQGDDVQKPSLLGEMITIAEKLGEGLEFARVDLYQPDQNTIKFGEITIAPGAGYERFSPTQYDFEFGSYWP